MSSVLFKIISSNGNEIELNTDEATITETQPYYSIELGSKKSSSGAIKQQVRPGKRYTQNYMMVLPQAKYIDFLNLITDQSDDFFIEYTEVPSLLANDDRVIVKNNFAISFTYGDPETMSGSDTINYHFPVEIFSVELL